MSFLIFFLIRKKILLLSKRDLFFAGFVIFSFIYINPFIFFEFHINKRIVFLLSFLLFLTFSKYIKLVDVKFFKIAVIFNLVGILCHYFFPEVFIQIAEIFVRKIKINEFTGRGPSGFMSEPAYQSLIQIYILILSKYFYKINKLKFIGYLLINLSAISIIILTKSATGYVLLILLLNLLYFNSLKLIILKITLITIILSYFTTFVLYFEFDNRGLYLVNYILTDPTRFFCDQSVLTRVTSILYAFYDLKNNLFGNGIGNWRFLIVEDQFLEIINNNCLINMQNTNILTDPFHNSNNLIQGSIFMSNIGIYIYEYGIFFILFLIIIFYTSDLNYYNIISRIIALLMISGTVSLAFPAIWVLIFIFENYKKNEI